MADLIDRDAVLAEIGEFQIRFNETGDSHERVAYASAEHCMLVIKAAPAVNRWIPCSESMPPIGKSVIVYIRTWFANNVQFAYRYSEDIWSIPQHSGVSNDSISYWMPLPEPPEKE